MASYNHEEIEKKWQARWKKSGIYNSGDRDTTRDKEYVLVEWPYPSGNLHIGHWFAFAVVDIYVRARRMLGKQVFFPMGFDAFGLPAENAAIKNNLNPKEWTDKNIAYMKGQLDSMGNAFSWDKTTSSTDPEYYKWTQWMFTKFFENDIAYRGEGIVNWCSSCNTVLANEQVLPEGDCERCGNQVEKKKMDEWKMRITRYADRLIDDLEGLDWPESIKESQRNWIGRSQGAKIDFKLSSGDVCTVFTTRPDTLYGATYMVLAPEHELVERLKNSISNWNEVYAYQREAATKDDIARTSENKEKTGVKLEGIYAINPANQEKTPVFIADYVLSGYGTGAIMAVPAHDERDFAFAKKFSLPVVEVISRGGDSEDIFTGEGVLINSEEFDGISSEDAKEKITAKVGGELTNTYRLRDWSIGRQRYWGVPIPIVYDSKGKAHPIPEEHLPWLLPEDVDFRPTGEPPLAKSKELRERTEKIFGVGWTPEVETMDTFVDSSWYFLRYIDNKNDTKFSSIAQQKEWMPIDVYFGGAEHTTMHLLYSRFWQKALFDLELVTEHEPYKKRVNRGLVLGPDGNKMSKSKGNVIDPDEQVKRLGSDAVKMYLAFMGPYGETTNYPWDLGGIVGIRRFLEKLDNFVDKKNIMTSEDVHVQRYLHQTIKKVGEDIQLYKFNTAISQLMIFLNRMQTLKVTKETLETFLKLLAPFAPHLTEELWERMENDTSIHLEEWPEYDESKLVSDTVSIAVQINGKTRGVVEGSLGATEGDILSIVTSSPEFSQWIEGEPKRVIYVAHKLINLVF